MKKEKEEEEEEKEEEENGKVWGKGSRKNVSRCSFPFQFAKWRVYFFLFILILERNVRKMTMNLGFLFLELLRDCFETHCSGSSQGMLVVHSDLLCG